MTSIQKFQHSFRYILLYGAMMAALVFLLKLFHWKFLIADYSFEIYVSLIAVFFTILGSWIATQLAKSTVPSVMAGKTIYPESPSRTNEFDVKNLKLTTREKEVLDLLVAGCSNAEIADHLCLSLSTIKTHASSLYTKMGVRTRAQALEKANRLKLTSR